MLAQVKAAGCILKYAWFSESKKLSYYSIESLLAVFDIHSLKIHQKKLNFS
jgi:hypothetical protein